MNSVSCHNYDQLAMLTNPTDLTVKMYQKAQAGYRARRGLVGFDHIMQFES